MKKITTLSIGPNKYVSRYARYTCDVYAVTGEEDVTLPEELNIILQAIVGNEFYVHIDPDCPELKIRSRGLIISDHGILNIQKKDGYPFNRIILKEGIPYIELCNNGNESITFRLLRTSELDVETVNSHFYCTNRSIYNMNYKIKAFIVFPISLEGERVRW